MTPDPQRFPIHEVLPRLQAILADSARLVLEAPPGAGKTTQVPLAMLAAPWLQGRRIIMLEPRRVAARAAAAFMARQLNEPTGQTVGYRIRFDNKVSTATRIEVVTEGILTRMLQDDPGLDGVGAIIFDEFHERHLSSDLGLALALDVQGQLRPDLRLLVMSATLDGERLAAWLDAPRLTAAGRSHPVNVSWFAAQRNEPLPRQLRRCLLHACGEHPGDVLVFLPGQREIRQSLKLLEGDLLEGFGLVPLYGELPIEQQSLALAPDPAGKRRIVLATNLAESSVTLPGVRVVIDSGLAREPRFDPNSGFTRLETVLISQASADQRSGRAGRVAEGWCYRLWSPSQPLMPSRNPEINLVDLSNLALELAAWGDDKLQFPDPPPRGALAAARDLLSRLGAIDAGGHITDRGRRTLVLGTHPRLAAMLLQARSPEEQSLACDLTALLEARDPLPGYDGDDWAARWLALDAWRKGRNFAGVVSRDALEAIDQTSRQWRQRLGRTREAAARDSLPGPAPGPGEMLMHAYPDRIARHLSDNLLRYRLSNGRGARLREDSRLAGEPWLVISELRHEQKDSLILRAAPVSESHLRDNCPQRFVEADRVYWDDNARALVARRETCFDDIVLDSRPAGKPDPVQAASALCTAVRQLGLGCLPWDEGLQQWRTRVLCLRQWMPELGLPDLSDPALLSSLETWLGPAFTGKYRLDALSAAELTTALHSLLDWTQRQVLDRQAPVRLRVPSGLERPITYATGSAPVLAVKLQELFGLADTPRIAEGRVPLTLHLLSPGGKPLQITQDLRSFWDRTYPEVKKEMKGRYPRHPWPEDPWNATATHRAKPRGT